MYVQIVAGDSNIYADAVPNLFKSIIYINWVFGPVSTGAALQSAKIGASWTTTMRTTSPYLSDRANGVGGWVDEETTSGGGN